MYLSWTRLSPIKSSAFYAQINRLCIFRLHQGISALCDSYHKYTSWDLINSFRNLHSRAYYLETGLQTGPNWPLRREESKPVFQEMVPDVPERIDMWIFILILTWKHYSKEFPHLLKNCLQSLRYVWESRAYVRVDLLRGNLKSPSRFPGSPLWDQLAANQFDFALHRDRVD